MHNRASMSAVRVVSAALLLLTAACSAPPALRRLSDACPQPTYPPDQIQLIEAIIYARHGGETQKLDVFKPRTARDPLPAVLCIHGGGWSQGKRTDKYIRQAAELLVSHGYVAISPSYRLAPEHPFPAAVADVRECVRWLRRHADRFGIDPRRMGATGISAGGHLTLMLALAGETDPAFGREDGRAGPESTRIQAAVNYFGPSDLAAKDTPLLTAHRYVQPFLEGRPDERPETYRAASPITYITPDDPPVLTFQGTADPLVPKSQAVRLHQKLDEAGVVNELIVLTGQGHGWVGSLRDQTNRAMVAFFDAHLKPPGQATPAGGATPSSSPAGD